MYGDSSIASSRSPAGDQLIKEISIQNFRCYQDIVIDNCSRINVVVGGNGAGKTALLEAVFLALVSSPEVGTRYRAQRGLDAHISGGGPSLDRALWRDMFFQGNMDRPVFISLKATGRDKRSVKVGKNVQQSKVLLESKTKGEFDEPSPGVRFVWIDSKGNKHEQTAVITGDGITVRQVAGDPEQPMESAFYIPANGIISAAENASRFSALSVEGKKNEFIEIFQSEYPWIKDMSIEMNAGSGAIYAHVDRPLPAIRPLAYVSGGISKIVSILLCMASVENSIVLVDEIENGIHHEHHAAVWRMLFAMAKKHNTQLILSTHSSEWLDAMVSVGGEDSEQVSLWRVQQGKAGVEVKQFSGRQAFVAIESGSEVR